MNNVSKLAIVSFGLIALGLSAVITVSESSPNNGDDDSTSPTIVSTSFGDGDNNVPVDTNIKVSFSEIIDEDSINNGSLTVTNLDSLTDPDIQDVLVSNKSATFSLQDQLLPGTDYEVTISSNVQDKDHNLLDCSDSIGVDDSCSWQFSTSDMIS